MRRVSAVVMLALGVGLMAGCDDSESTTASLGDEGAITRAAEAYFTFDRTPDPDEYCTSYVELQRSDSFRAGDLTEDAARTESKCRAAFEALAEAPERYQERFHIGEVNSEIEDIEIDGDRGHVLVTFTSGDQETDRNAWVGKVADGDWRILNAGYD